MARKLRHPSEPSPESLSRQRADELLRADARKYFGIPLPSPDLRVASQCLSDCEWLQQRMHHQAEALQAISAMLERPTLDGLDHAPAHRNHLASLFTVLSHHADSLNTEMDAFLQPIRDALKEPAPGAQA